MAKVLTIPVLPDPTRPRKPRKSDPRYIEGQRLIVEAMRHLAQQNPQANRAAIDLLFEHFMTRFRATDVPSALKDVASNGAGQPPA